MEGIPRTPDTPPSVLKAPVSPAGAFALVGGPDFAGDGFGFRVYPAMVKGWRRTGSRRAFVQENPAARTARSSSRCGGFNPHAQLDFKSLVTQNASHSPLSSRDSSSTFGISYIEPITVLRSRGCLGQFCWMYRKPVCCPASKNFANAKFRRTTAQID